MILDGILHVVQIMFNHCYISLVTVQSSGFIFTILVFVGYIHSRRDEIYIWGKNGLLWGEIRIRRINILIKNSRFHRNYTLFWGYYWCCLICMMIWCFLRRIWMVIWLFCSLVYTLNNDSITRLLYVCFVITIAMWGQSY